MARRTSQGMSEWELSSSDEEGSNSQSQEEDHHIFATYSAWFSESVESGWIEDWRNNGGEVTDVESAQFLFSENCESSDTLRIYESDQFRKQHVAVIHALFIDECLKKKSLEAVAIGQYYIPPKQVQQLLGNDHNIFKWQVPRKVDETCEMLPKTRTTAPRKNDKHKSVETVTSRLDSSLPNAEQGISDLANIGGAGDVRNARRQSPTELEVTGTESNLKLQKPKRIPKVCGGGDGDCRRKRKCTSEYDEMQRLCSVQPELRRRHINPMITSRPWQNQEDNMPVIADTSNCIVL